MIFRLFLKADFHTILIMKSIIESTSFSLRERGSKFYGILFPCPTLGDFEAILSEQKKKYQDATHHCSAYRLLKGELIEHANDDGEPSGTAGLPILNALKSAEIINIGAIIIRYYGGTKLGKSGLIEAYGNTTLGCIESANLREIVEVQELEITYDYALENDFNRFLHAFDLKESDADFGISITKIVPCPLQVETKAWEFLLAMEYKGFEIKKNGHTFVMI